MANGSPHWPFCFPLLLENFYKEWMRSTYIKHYKESKPYIEGIRKESPKVYICFQKLAEKWDKETISPSA